MQLLCTVLYRLSKHIAGTLDWLPKMLVDGDCRLVLQTSSSTKDSNADLFFCTETNAANNSVFGTITHINCSLICLQRRFKLHLLGTVAEYIVYPGSRLLICLVGCLPKNFYFLASIALQIDYRTNFFTTLR